MNVEREQRKDSIDFEGPEFSTDWNQFSSQNSVSHIQFIQECGNDYDKPDTNNATKIYDLGDLQKYSFKRRWLKKMDRYNSGLQNLNWVNDPYITYITNRHQILALSNQLDLTEEQSKRVYHRFMRLNLEEWGYSSELIAFCVCAVTVHYDGTNRKYHYNQNDRNKDPVFVKILDSLNLSQRLVRKVYSKYYNFVNNRSNPDSDYKKYQKRSTDWRGI